MAPFVPGARVSDLSQGVVFNWQGRARKNSEKGLENKRLKGTNGTAKATLFPDREPIPLPSGEPGGSQDVSRQDSPSLLFVPDLEAQTGDQKPDANMSYNEAHPKQPHPPSLGLPLVYSPGFCALPHLSRVCFPLPLLFRCRPSSVAQFFISPLSPLQKPPRSSSD